MIFHENRLLQKLPSDAVVIGALRVNNTSISYLKDIWIVILIVIIIVMKIVDMMEIIDGPVRI